MQDINEILTILAIIRDDEKYCLSYIVDIIRNHHNIIFYKADKRHFFTCNFPVIFSKNLKDLNAKAVLEDGLSVMTKYPIAYPISPQVCVFLFPIETNIANNTQNIIKIKKAKSKLLKRILCTQCWCFQTERKLILVSDKIHSVDKRIISKELIQIQKYQEDKEVSQNI